MAFMIRDDVYHAAKRQEAMRSDLVAQINTDDLVHNFHALKSCCRPGVRLCAPVKADAYGHSMAVVAPAVYEAGADSAAVATLSEAVELRELGWDRPILVLGNVLAVSDSVEREERLGVVLDYRLTLTITDRDVVDFIEEQDLPGRIDVHLKLDTGMGRMGATPDDGAMLLRRLINSTRIRLAGVYSHFATADFEDIRIAREQFAAFQRFIESSGSRMPPGVITHLANSAATITMPEAHFDMVRPGLALYGYYPSAHMRENIDLRPILRLVSHFSVVKELPAGHCVGYGKTFVTKRPTRLGIVPIGYADGYLRLLSNSSVVGTNWGDAPVIGRVSMDQMAVDLTDLPQAGPGSEVVLIDHRRERPNSVESIAERLGTIPYEVTCLLGERIDRVRTGKSCAISGTLVTRT